MPNRKTRRGLRGSAGSTQRGSTQHGADPRSDMTPMIDVTFLLLIFFMLTIQFKTLEGLLAAHLPGDVGPGPIAGEPRERVDLSIEVLREGARLDPYTARAWSGEGPWRHASDRLVRWSVGPWSTHDEGELIARLVSIHRSEADRRVVIDARPGTVYAEAVAALDAVTLAGWNDVTFAGQRARCRPGGQGRAVQVLDPG